MAQFIRYPALSVSVGAVTVSNFPATQAVTQSGTWTLSNAYALDSTLSTMSAKLPSALGQTTMAGSLAVAVASDQSAIPVTGTFWQATQPVSGTVAATQSGTWNITNISGTISLPTGAATESTLSAMSGKLPATLGQKTMANSMAVTISSDQSAIPATQSGTWTVQPGNTANTTAWLVKEEPSTTATVSSVSSSATNVTILASNASRKGAAVYNDSTQVLYLKLGTTASSTSYTVQIPSGGYFELPNPKVYTGQIDGIWASANGAARVTEW